MNTLTQKLCFRQSVVLYSQRNSVFSAIRKFGISRATVYRWRKMYDGTLNSLVEQSRRPFTPRHNGKVERSHRKDNEYFYATHKFYSFNDFSKQLAVRLKRYNSFLMRPLARKSPKQYVSDYLNLGLIHS